MHADSTSDGDSQIPMRHRPANRSEAAMGALDRVTPLLIDTLTCHWSTGQGTRVRQVIWSLYNGNHLVSLGHACTGLDDRLAEALRAAITARLVLGPEVENRLCHILKVSGEFARFDQAEKITPQNLPVAYPPVAVSSNLLRRLADATDAMEW